MPSFRVKTLIDKDGTRYHIVGENSISCSGQDCEHCQSGKTLAFEDWENSVLYPIPPRGKKYKKEIIQRNRGKTIREICYSCKKIPCYLCRRTKCKLWHKEQERKGQEIGCQFWEKGRCKRFQCKKGIIKTFWDSKGGENE